MSDSSRKKSADRLGAGLPSVEQARRDRRRRKWMPPRFWLWAALFISAGVIIWWRIEEGKIQSARDKLLADQRRIVAQIGPRWYPLRDNVEKWTQECGADLKPGVEPEVGKTWDFRKLPGIYLRLSQAASKTPEKMRAASKRSLHDGFTSCMLLNGKKHAPGKRCLTTAECAPGQLCNDFKECAEHTQPFNLRIAYNSVSVLSDEWVEQIQEISNNLTVRGATATFEDIKTYDLPIVTELLEKAEYFMVVVDEPAIEVDPNLADHTLPGEADAGSDDRSIATAPHKARVCVWRLSDNKRMVAVKADAAGALVGGPTAPTLRTRIAMQRQANSCALALAVREAMGVESGAAVPNNDAIEPGDDAAPSSASASAVPAASAPRPAGSVAPQ